MLFGTGPQALETPDLVGEADLVVCATTATEPPFDGELVGVAPDRLVNLAELREAPVDLDRPRLFKSVGMAWEDLVVVAAAHTAQLRTG